VHKRELKLVKFSPAGFTLIELLVVSMLMVGTVTMMAQFWRTLSLSMNDLTARSKTAEEMRFIVENISKDFGPAVGATIFDDDHILICQDGGKSPNGLADWDEPDIMVEYFLSEGRLHRLDQSAGVETIAGDDISLFLAEDIPGSLMRMTIETEHGEITRQITFMWSRP
jgi:prepilin-type N-terminal cleavage/methylation domain-containing protein